MAKRINSLSCCVVMISACVPATAGVVVIGPSELVEWTVNAAVPDNDGTGIADTRTVTGSAIRRITNLEVRLQVSGGWNGDLYAYLAHDSGFSVLLNRPGRSETNTLGSGSSELQVTFSDFSSSDIHTQIGDSGVVSGLFQPDARDVDPNASLATSPRSAFLDSFNGLDANGEWTLFMADLSAGDQSTLDGWGLRIEGQIPEPSPLALSALGLLGAWWRRRRG